MKNPVLKFLAMSPQRKIAKALSLVVIIAGIMVIIGWIFDIAILKSIFPHWVSMKFDTAIAFILSGITLYSIVREIGRASCRERVSMFV
jgi:hypothetical protein